MPGKLLFRGDKVYTFTKADRDLLVRALYGEEGADPFNPGQRGGLAVSVCMINRWAMFLTLPWYRKLLLQKPEAKVYGYDSFDDMLSAYSQPVNPIWLNGGRKDPDPSHVDDKEKRRSEILEKPIGEFPKAIRDAVDGILGFADQPWSTAALNGSLLNGVPEDMAGIVHFYCPAYYYARKLKRRPTDAEVEFAAKTAFGSSPSDGKIFSPVKGVSLRSNVFYKVGRSKSWKPGDVRVEP